MRKQALALWAVGARGEHFEEWRLFPGRSTARGERFEDWRLFPGRSTARRAAQSRRCVL
jgi:hypothetical protein